VGVITVNDYIPDVGAVLYEELHYIQMTATHSCGDT
jgi:hypothetical protein